jgi:hypothetical protein
MQDVTLTSAHHAYIDIDHQQFFIYDGAPSEYLWTGAGDVGEALSEAVDSHRYVGSLGRLVAVAVPIGWTQASPMLVEVHAVEPPVSDSNWDHVVDVDFDNWYGRLCFAAPESEEAVTSPIPPSKYRMRVSARGYDTPDVESSEAFMVQLWSRTEDTAPIVRRRWPGWDTYSY